MMRSTCCAMFLLSAAAAHADAVLEYEGGDAACHGDFARLAVQGLSLRVDSAPPAQDMSFVYDAAEKAGVALDHRRKQFFEMEFDDDAIDFQGDVMKSTSNMVGHKMDKVQAQAAEACAHSGRPCATPMPPAGANGMAMPQIDPKMIEQMMQQNMQNMPPEQRARMREAMNNLRASGYGGMAPQAAPVVEATGEQRQVGAVACAVERVSQDGQLLREDCRAALDAIGLDAADVKRLQRAITRLQKFSSAIRDNLHLPYAAAMQRREQPDPQHLLIARRCYDQGRATGEIALRVRHDAGPSEWFTTPADYARMDMRDNANRRGGP